MPRYFPGCAGKGLACVFEKGYDILEKMFLVRQMRRDKRVYSERIRSQILSGCLADFPGYLYGVYQGYHVSVQRAEMQYKILMVKINASSEIDINLSLIHI